MKKKIIQMKTMKIMKIEITNMNLEIIYIMIMKNQKMFMKKEKKMIIKEEEYKDQEGMQSNEMFYININKYMKNSTKIKRKIQRDIDYITREKYSSKLRYTGINRPKSVFNNNTININQIIKVKIFII